MSAALAAVLALAAAESEASALERFAAVGGSTDDPFCIEVPCTLERAVEVVALDGDFVTVLPGTHDLGGNALEIDDPVQVQGAAGQPMPTIVSAGTAGGVLLNDVGATLQDLAILHEDPDLFDGVGSALNIGSLATVRRVVARSNTDSNTAAGCSVASPPAGDMSIRDTLCASTSDVDGQGLRIDTGALTLNLTIRNVTAVSQTDRGVSAIVQANETLNLTAISVIASGPQNDVSLTVSGIDPEADIDLEFSNYDAISAGDITPVGSATNQTTAPVFVNSTAGDFHQAPTSTGTIDRGSPLGGLSTADVDGDPRSQGAAPDIGADELNADTDRDGIADAADACPRQAGPASNSGCPMPTPTDTDGDGVPNDSDACPSQPGPASNSGCPDGVSGDTDPPQTTIGRKPRGEIEAGPVKVRFRSDEADSTFQCRLDRRKFRRCSSPKVLRNLGEGKHVFRVRAIDAAGNFDKTPAKRRFEVIE